MSDTHHVEELALRLRARDPVVEDATLRENFQESGQDRATGVRPKGTGVVYTDDAFGRDDLLQVIPELNSEQVGWDTAAGEAVVNDDVVLWWCRQCGVVVDPSACVGKVNSLRLAQIEEFASIFVNNRVDLDDGGVDPETHESVGSNTDSQTAKNKQVSETWINTSEYNAHEQRIVLRTCLYKTRRLLQHEGRIDRVANFSTPGWCLDPEPSKETVVRSEITESHGNMLANDNTAGDAALARQQANLAGVVKPWQHQRFVGIERGCDKQCRNRDWEKKPERRIGGLWSLLLAFSGSSGWTSCRCNDGYINTAHRRYEAQAEEL